MAVSLTRTVRFQATHRYWIPEWSGAENRARFGDLVEPHPHHYACDVTVAGPPDPRTGMCCDLGLLDQLLEEEVVRRLDGKDLNRDLPEFGPGGPLPTCEALATRIFERLAPRLPTGVRLKQVGIAEDPALRAECTGLE
jgi:6-pyruvoyltetrahydropterin/6-carboxytetrahydropterin synthase